MTPTIVPVPLYRTGPHRLFGASTLLMDRIVPAVERIDLPPAVSPGGTVTVTPGAADRLDTTRTGLRALRHRLRADRPPAPVAGPVLDLRAYAPSNWSHALMIHLPLAAAAADVLGQSPVAVLPFAIPGYVRSAFALMGFETVATDHAVAGDVCAAVFDDINIMKQATLPFMAERAARFRAAASGEPLPERVFVPRRGTRAIANQAEVEAVLAPLGYRTVYAETLSPADQLRLFDGATHIVGVHGAALSPICYRSPDRDPPVLVEILPAAHMTNYFRLVVDQQNGRYAAVRGRITPADIAAAYKAEPYVAHSLDPFHVDVESLRLALAEVGADRS